MIAQLPLRYRAIVLPVAEDPLLDALDITWSRIRAEHEHVPPAIFVIGQMSACNQPWHAGRPVVLSVSPQRTATGILEQLLHWAAHALVPVSQASGHRFHPIAYKDAAAEVGLAAEERPGTGWSATSLARGTRSKYAAELVRLAGALKKRGDPGSPYSRNGVSVSCQCSPRRLIRVRGVNPDPDDIRCLRCGQLFEVRS